MVKERKSICKPTGHVFWNSLFLGFSPHPALVISSKFKQDFTLGGTLMRRLYKCTWHHVAHPAGRTDSDYRTGQGLSLTPPCWFHCFSPGLHSFTFHSLIHQFDFIWVRPALAIDSSLWMLSRPLCFSVIREIKQLVTSVTYHSDSQPSTSIRIEFHYPLADLVEGYAPGADPGRDSMTLTLTQNY